MKNWLGTTWIENDPNYQRNQLILDYIIREQEKKEIDKQKNKRIKK